MRLSKSVVIVILTLLCNLAYTSGLPGYGMSNSTLTSNPEIARLFGATTRSTTWNQTRTIHLNFNTFHPQGIAITPGRLFITAVEIIEASVAYPQPQNGLDRSPGKGLGHVFVLDYDGKLLKDIQLQEGNKYHPGGIDFDGENIWVPLAEYRPNSAASIYRLDVSTLTPEKIFDAGDHYGGIVFDKTTGHLIGNNWGSRNFTAWTPSGKIVAKWANQNFFIDFQDGQYIEGGKAICSGVANLRQNPAAVSAIGQNGTTPLYELGGLSLIDLHTHAILHEIPVSLWSKIGHSINRNPAKLVVQDGKLVLWAAPDDGNEVGGTDIMIFEAKI